MYAESGGQLQEFLQIVKRRKWQIVVPALFLFGFSLMVVVIVPRKFKAEGKLVMRAPRIEADRDATSIAMEIENADEHLKNHERVRAVLDALQWDDYEALKRKYPGPNRENMRIVDEYIKRQRQALSAVPNQKDKSRRASAFLTVNYKNVDPKRAEDFIRELVTRWAAEISTQDELALAEELDALQNEGSAAQDEFLQALDREKDIEAELGILTLTDTNGPPLRDDPALRELGGLRIDLTKLRSTAAGVQGEVEEIRKQIAAEEDTVVREVKAPQADAVTAVARIEQQIADLEKQKLGLKPPHSKYAFIESEIARLRTELGLAQKAVGVTITRQETVPNEHKAQLQADLSRREIELRSLQAQQDLVESRIANLEEETARRTALSKELEEARAVRSAAETAWTDLEKQIAQKMQALNAIKRANAKSLDWDTPPTAERTPSEPNPFLILAVGLAGGIALGLGSTMLTEFAKSCYRSVADVSAVMTLPILGVVNEIVTREQRRAARRKGVVILGSSVVVLGSLGWFTWAYTARPEILPPGLVEQVEELRAPFK